MNWSMYINSRVASSDDTAGSGWSVSISENKGFVEYFQLQAVMYMSQHLTLLTHLFISLVFKLNHYQWSMLTRR